MEMAICGICGLLFANDAERQSHWRVHQVSGEEASNVQGCSGTAGIIATPEVAARQASTKRKRGRISKKATQKKQKKPKAPSKRFTAEDDDCSCRSNSPELPYANELITTRQAAAAVAPVSVEKSSQPPDFVAATASSSKSSSESKKTTAATSVLSKKVSSPVAKPKPRPPEATGETQRDKVATEQSAAATSAKESAAGATLVLELPKLQLRCASASPTEVDDVTTSYEDELMYAGFSLLGIQRKNATSVLKERHMSSNIVAEASNENRADASTAMQNWETAMTQSNTTRIRRVGGQRNAPAAAEPIPQKRKPASSKGSRKPKNQARPSMASEITTTQRTARIRRVVGHRHASIPIPEKRKPPSSSGSGKPRKVARSSKPGQPLVAVTVDSAAAGIRGALDVLAAQRENARMLLLLSKDPGEHQLLLAYFNTLSEDALGEQLNSVEASTEAMAYAKILSSALGCGMFQISAITVTPLILAILLGNSDLVAKVLVAFGVQVNVAAKGSLIFGCDAAPKDFDILTAAVCSDSLELVQLLLTQRCLPDLGLPAAVLLDKVPMLEAMLHSLPNLFQENKVFGPNESSALCVQDIFFNVVHHMTNANSILQILLDRGAQITDASIGLALHRDNAEVTDWLLEKSDDKDLPGKLFLQFANGPVDQCIPLITALLKARPDIYASVYNDGSTVLMMSAATEERLPLLKTLLESIEEPSFVNQQRDHDGRTALHVAAENGNIGAAELLLQHRAHPMLADFHGVNPLAAAFQAGLGEDKNQFTATFSQMCMKALCNLPCGPQE